MKIWIDADSCPTRIREIIIRASNREKIEAVFVANRELPLLYGNFVRFVLVPEGSEEADKYITEQAAPDDIVITRDIPFASLLVEKGIIVLNDRGTLYTVENMGERLSIRNFMKGLRERNLYSSRESEFGKKEVENFANTFDRELRKKLQ